MRKLVATVLFGAAGLAIAAPTNKAKLTFGTPTVTGTFDVKVLTATMKRSSDKLLACYKTVLAKHDELQGVATATFTIGADGKVTATAAAGLGKDVETCLTAALAKITFPKPKDGSSVDVSIPLSFERGFETGAFASLTGTGDVSSGFDDSNIYGGLLGNEAGEMNGSGSAGFGRGGGGTGWGTIGTGRYGTIGHGSGTGSGYGVGGGRGGMRGRTSDVATVSIGQPNVAGDLDKAIVRRYIKRNMQKLLYCYEKQLLAKPGIQGTISAEFTIDANGIVGDSKAKGVDKDVSACVADVIHAIEFPKPKGGAVTVYYPLTFRPGEAAAKPDAKATKPDAKTKPDPKPADPAKPDAVKPADPAAKPDATKK